MFNLMCDDLEAARLNRERVKKGETNQYYDQLNHRIAQWQWGEPNPKDIPLGELPYVGKIRPRIVREED